MWFTSKELKEMAVDRAKLFTNELKQRTGKEYSVRAFTMGSHFVVIRDENTTTDIFGFSGKRWEDVFCSVRDAWNAYLAPAYYE